METLKKQKTETEKSKFKPQLLNNNEKKFKSLVEQYERNLNVLNTLVDEAEKLLDRSLKDSEKQTLSKGNFEFVIEELESKFHFPKSDKAFNYQAMGIDLATFKKLAKTFSTQHTYVLKNGEFSTSKKYLDEVKESFAEYTSNEKQNEALELANEMIELIRIFNEKGYGFSIAPILTLGTPIISLGDKFKHVPFYSNIKKL